MRLPRFGIITLVTFLIVLILNLDVGLDSVGQAFDTHKLNISAKFSSGDKDTELQIGSQVLAQTPDARKAEADRLFNQGNQQYQTSQFEGALQSWQQALVIYQKIQDPQGEEATLGNLGVAYYSLGDYEKAIDYQQQRLNIAREIKDPQGEGQSLGNLGVAYYSLGDYIKAIEYHQQFLDIARDLHYRQGEEAALGNLGIAYYSLGDYAKAIDYQQQSLDIAKEIKDRQGEGQSLGNLGNTYYSLGDYGKAIHYQQQRLNIAIEIKDPQGEGQSLGNLGVAYDSLGDYAKAIDYQQQYLIIAQEIKDRNGEEKALANLGIAYLDLGDYAKAIEYHQQSLDIAREIKDREGEGQSLGNLGVAYLKLKDYAKVIEYEQQYLDIVQAIKDRNSEGIALGNLGIAYKNLGDYNKAIDYQKQRLAIAQEIKDRHGEEYALANLGVAYLDLGDYTKAIDYQKQVLAITREIHDRQGEGLTLNNLGNALFKSGNLTAAEETLLDGVKVYESIRVLLGNNDTNKVSIFETQSSTYNILQQVLITQNKTDNALEISERGRARAFVELLASRLSSNATESVTIAPPTIEQLKQTAKDQNATLVEYSIIYDDFKIENKQESKESELYIWVIKPTGEVTFRKSDLKPLWRSQKTSLDQLVGDTRDSIGVKRGLGVVPRINVVSPAKRLQQLYQILIKPIADLLPTQPNAHVIFIPQNALFLVPFPALKDEQGNYLIDKYAILTAPSIQVLELTHQKRMESCRGEAFGRYDIGLTKTLLTKCFAPPDVESGNPLIVGNPTMPSVAPYPGEQPQQLPALPNAEAEAKAIASLLHTQALTGNQATETVVVEKMQQASLVHLATHGLLDDIRGIGSAIALTPSDKDNGLLTAEEILNLKINAQLVVLSACDTGRGKITGDGVVGLSRSLISAGVSSVIVSLWSVPDAPTAELMTEFYQNWQKNPDKAQALRQAMVTTKEKHPNPIDWAAFTLIGES